MTKKTKIGIEKEKSEVQVATERGKRGMHALFLLVEYLRKQEIFMFNDINMNLWEFKLNLS